MTTKTMFAAVLAVLWALPGAAQETPPDTTTTTYESAPAPVWLVVEDVEGEAGAHQVRAAVMWDDRRSALRFSTDVQPGHLLAFLPTSATADDLADVCVFSSNYMAHESQRSVAMERDDANCTAPAVADLPFVAVEHRGAPLTCVAGRRTDGAADVPTRRYYGCYWEHNPGGG